MAHRAQVTDWQAVSRRIREARSALGWTQERLGTAVGSSANYVNRVEAGLPISEKKLAIYAAALGVSVPWLRYEVADAVDVAAIRRMAREQARAELLTELSAWTIAAGAPQLGPVVQPGPTTPSAEEHADFFNKERDEVRGEEGASRNSERAAAKSAAGGTRGRGRRR